MGSLIDWDLAAATAKRLSPAPPSVDRATAEAAVAELYRATHTAAAHVAELTQLEEPPVSARTTVVDRAGWIDVNVRGMQKVMTPLVEKLTDANPVGRFGQAIGGRITGTQAGAIVAFLSSKVLGQFEFFADPGGQLMLVAPNLVATERQLKVDPADFRLWVCLHEVTHRVQFTAVPWMRQHMLAEVSALSETIDADPNALWERINGALSELSKVARGQGDGAGVMALLATPEQRAVLDRVTGFMSLVEGHAEYVMNAVSPDVIPSQRLIEQRFGQRRKGGNPLDKLLRKLLGLDAKTRQYVNGSAFVRTVVDRVGIEDFNAIWSSPQTLPTKAEIAVPADWIARVHG
ncbi:putative hydrolase/uncharacterized protein, coenzyme F420 biosynthesis associated [Frankineae bacterium MT45]|nr:putative hydrolase/uncharacterized protein, coenzyme F420 biosynthesis associated [Frankineae bacterium MT45]